MKSNTSSSVELKQTLELFLSYWKWILLCVILAAILGFTHLRYADFIYKANATIKKEIAADKKLPYLIAVPGITKSDKF